MESVAAIQKRGEVLSELRKSLSKYGVYIAFFLLVTINTIFTPNFLSVNTFLNLIIYSSIVLLVAMGMNLVIATGGIDISVGATMALSATTIALLLPRLGLLPSVAAAIAVALLAGFIIGTVIEKFAIQPIIVTLSMMIGIRGVAQILSLGKIVNIQLGTLSHIAYMRVGGVLPIQLFIGILVLFIFYTLVNKTVLGRYIEAVGDNREAAYIMGVNIKNVIKFVYIIAAVMAGIAGIFQAARLSSANPNTLGMLVELDAIASVAIGGTVMSGGKPKIINTAVGVLIMQLITTSINMNDIQYSYSLILKTVIIILAVYIQKEKRGR